MGLNQNLVVFSDDSYSDNVNSTNRRDGVSKTGLAVGQLEPEVVDVLSAGFDTPRSERIRGQAGLQPIRERLRRRKRVVVELVIGPGHDGDFEKTAGVRWESKEWDFEGTGGVARF